VGYTLPVPLVLQTLETGTGAVLQWTRGTLTDITPSYRARLRRKGIEQELPSTLNPGNPLFDRYFSKGWYQGEGLHRWMGQQAEVQIGGSGRNLHLTGFCASAQQNDAPFALTVMVDEVTFAPVVIRDCGSAFNFTFPLTAKQTEPRRYKVKLALNKVSILDFDKRALGLAMQRIEVR
jgi:hypothetical protein